MSSSRSNRGTCQSKTTLQRPSFPLAQKPEMCWAFEHMAPANIVRQTCTFLDDSVHIERPYYICITCDNAKTNVYRNSGYPRGFVTWDDYIGIDARNPKCYCGFASRQDHKARRECFKGVEGGFWVRASGACHYYSDRKDGVDYEDARELDDFDEFKPLLLEGVPRFF